MKITAVVVTFNRVEHVKKSIEQMLNLDYPPHEIVVVNNASTDNTQAVLSELCLHNPNIAVTTTIKNIGGAGGFAVGMKVAYDRGADFVWIMDDDAYAEPSSLKRLYESYSILEQHGIKAGFICSKVNWTDGNICEMNQPGVSWDWMRRGNIIDSLVKVDSCSFVSCLIPREVIDEVGLPMHEFFIWFDDMEYTKRISRVRECFFDTKSIVVHAPVENRGVYFALVRKDTLWKYSYGARNESWYRLHRDGIGHWLVFIASKLRDMSVGKVPYGIRWFIVKAIFAGAVSKFKVQDVDSFKLTNFIKL